MGECGCGEFQPYEAYRVGDYILAIELYRGCNYCDTGLMVSLLLMTPEYAAEWDMEIKEEFKPNKHGYKQISFPMVGKTDLVKAAREIEKSDGALLPHYDTLADIMGDYGLKLLQKGLSIRLKGIRELEQKKSDTAPQAPETD